MAYVSQLSADPRDPVSSQITWAETHPATSDATVALNAFAEAASIALWNNPRVNPVMATPPVVTASGSPTAGLTNTWTWNGPKAGVFNFYGGSPVDDGAGFASFLCTTVNGSLVAYLWRVEIVTDAVKVQFQVLNTAGIARFIVDGRYVSATTTTPPGGVVYLTLDFTSAGGRAMRSIIMEVSGMDFGAVAVGVTETVTKPTGSPKRMMVVGDSFAGGGGMTSQFLGFVQVVGDLLGIRDVWNNGVGGTGYLVSTGQTTFRQRLSDLVRAAPSIALIVGGHNDVGSTPQALQAEVLAYLSAIRAQSVLRQTIVIIAGLNGANNPLATTQPFETAMGAAVRTFGDPLVWFVPQVTNAAGPYFTGTGSTAAPTGTGNCDRYMSADYAHPNDAGHAYMARCMADDIRRLVFAA